MATEHRAGLYCIGPIKDNFPVGMAFHFAADHSSTQVWESQYSTVQQAVDALGGVRALATTMTLKPGLRNDQDLDSHEEAALIDATNDLDMPRAIISNNQATRAWVREDKDDLWVLHDNEDIRGMGEAFTGWFNHLIRAKVL